MAVAAFDEAALRCTKHHLGIAIALEPSRKPVMIGMDVCVDDLLELLEGNAEGHQLAHQSTVGSGAFQPESNIT